MNPGDIVDVLGAYPGLVPGVVIALAVSLALGRRVGHKLGARPILGIALVMAENLKAAGFKVDMQVVDWATLIQRRNDAALWDIYITHSAVLPEPTLTPPQLGEGAPGWWSSPAKKAALDAFDAESDPAKRGPLWGKVQEVVYTEVPYIRVGSFNSVTARSAKLDGYVAMPWPFFWNTGLQK